MNDTPVFEVEPPSSKKQSRTDYRPPNVRSALKYIASRLGTGEDIRLRIPGTLADPGPQSLTKSPSPCIWTFGSVGSENTGTCLLAASASGTMIDRARRIFYTERFEHARPNVRQLQVRLSHGMKIVLGVRIDGEFAIAVCRVVDMSDHPSNNRLCQIELLVDWYRTVDWKGNQETSSFLPVVSDRTMEWMSEVAIKQLSIIYNQATLTMNPLIPAGRAQRAITEEAILADLRSPNVIDTTIEHLWAYLGPLVYQAMYKESDYSIATVFGVEIARNTKLVTLDTDEEALALTYMVVNRAGDEEKNLMPVQVVLTKAIYEWMMASPFYENFLSYVAHEGVVRKLYDLTWERFLEITRPALVNVPEGVATRYFHRGYPLRESLV